MARLAARNTHLPKGVFRIPESKLKEWALLFEPPSQEEFE
jgi:hypothetical protein